MRDEGDPVPGSIYHIRVQGHLDQKWADWFGSFIMTARASGQTLLSGDVTDQAALHGVLAKIWGLGLRLLLVVCVPCPCPEKDCPRYGECTACAAHRGAQLPYCFRPGTPWDRFASMGEDVEPD